MGVVAKSCMPNGLLIYGKFFLKRVLKDSFQEARSANFFNLCEYFYTNFKKRTLILVKLCEFSIR
jgi:hypothetical protein